MRRTLCVRQWNIHHEVRVGNPIARLSCPLWRALLASYNDSFRHVKANQSVQRYEAELIKKRQYLDGVIDGTARARVRVPARVPVYRCRESLHV